jgi:hypothetical protein
MAFFLALILFLAPSFFVLMRLFRPDMLTLIAT